MKKEKKLKQWEKYFLMCSILVIIVCLCFYSYRLFYYYKIEHDINEENINKLVNVIIDQNTSDALIPVDENTYYFKGTNVNNYVYYSSRMWQIISINENSIKMITTDNQTSLVWGVGDDYQQSYINNWLNGNDDELGTFINSLNNYEYYLNKENICIDKIDLDNITCNETINNYVGLLSVNEYLIAGGSDSFLNNGTYFWTSNMDFNNNIWYVFDEGGINNNSSSEVSYFSYGVRPVVSLKNTIMVYQGTGSIDDPFIIEEDNNILVGSYLNYSNNTYRVIEKNDNYIKIMMDDYLEVDNDPIKIIFDEKSNVFNNSTSIYKYLNNDFYNTIDKTYLKECSFNIGNYGTLSNYNYQNTAINTINSYVGLPSIGDFFINDNIWLANNIDEIKLTVYTSNKNGTLFSDSITNENYIKPIICLDNNIEITSGNGTKNNPFSLEVADEINN